MGTLSEDQLKTPPQFLFYIQANSLCTSSKNTNNSLRKGIKSRQLPILTHHTHHYIFLYAELPQVPDVYSYQALVNKVFSLIKKVILVPKTSLSPNQSISNPIKVREIKFIVAAIILITIIGVGKC